MLRLRLRAAARLPDARLTFRGRGHASQQSPEIGEQPLFLVQHRTAVMQTGADARRRR